MRHRRSGTAAGGVVSAVAGLVVSVVGIFEDLNVSQMIFAIHASAGNVILTDGERWKMCPGRLAGRPYTHLQRRDAYSSLQIIHHVQPYPNPQGTEALSSQSAV
jgi:hypothetical protein